MNVNKLIENYLLKKEDVDIYNMKKDIINNINYFEFEISPISTINNIKNQSKILGDNYTYQRLMTYSKIENKFKCLFEEHEEWISDIMLFNCGMSSIITIINTFLQGNKNKKINILSSYGYFESKYYIENLNFPVKSFFAKNHKDFIKIIKEIDIDILFLEPITYNVDMQELNLEKIIREFDNSVKKSSKIKMIIIDITIIHSLQFSLKNLQKLIKTNVILCTVQSLTKLNQFGLELINLGCGYISTHKKNSKIQNEFSKYCKKYRSLMGVNVPLFDLQIINNSCFYSIELISIYINKVFENNQYVYSKLNNKLFKHIKFSENYKIPFMIIILKEDYEEKYDEFINAIRKLNKNKCFNYGSSFGFYNSRYEKIIYDLKSYKCFLKISIGYNVAPLEDIISVLNKIK